MSVETMRWLDRWLGVPLCFLFSLAACGRLVGRGVAVEERRPGRILCIQLAEMGSLVLAGPAVHWLARHGAEIWFVTFARNAGGLRAAGLVPAERVFLWRTETPLRFLIDFLGFLAWAWRRGFDAAIDFEPCSRFSALLAWLCAAGRRSGFVHGGAYRGGLHNRPVAYRADRHMSENCLALAAALVPGAPPFAEAERDWRGSLAPAGRGVVQRIGALLACRFAGRSPARLVVLNPNAGDLVPQRRWAVANWVALAEAMLAADGDRCIAVIGAADEADAVRSLVAQVGSPRCISLAGELEIDEIPVLFRHAQLLVSNDSGPAHLSTLGDIPALVLFGPETPRLYRPLGAARAIYAGLPCSPCIRVTNQRRSSCGDNRCMRAITVAEVHSAAERVLSDGTAADRRIASADS